MDFELFWRMWGSVITAAALCVPLGALLAWGLAMYRRRRNHEEPWRTALCDVGILVGTLPWYVMALRPGVGMQNVNLVPFSDIVDTIEEWPGAEWYVIVQIGGNLLVFFALGALLPIRSARFAGPPMGAALAKVAAVACAGSMLIEICQFGFRLERAASIDDVILNTAGAVVAAILTHRWWAGTKAREKARRSAVQQK